MKNCHKCKYMKWEWNDDQCYCKHEKHKHLICNGLNKTQYYVCDDYENELLKVNKHNFRKVE